jgi:hypothetical protein
MKTILIVAAMMLAGVVNAQTDMQKKKADFYATEALSHFKLNESKKTAIYDAKLGMLVAQKEMDAKKKSGELPESEVDAYRRKNIAPFTAKLLEVIGVTWQELSPFNDIVHPKMNALKP